MICKYTVKELYTKIVGTIDRRTVGVVQAETDIK